MDDAKIEARKRVLGVTINNISVYLNPGNCKIINRDRSSGEYSVGSGVLVHLNGMFYLFTAAHTLKYRPIKDIEIYFYSKRGFIPICVEDFHANDDKNFDVAYLLLNGEDIVPYLAENPYQNGNILKRPFTRNIFGTELARNGIFIYGYPTEWDDYRLISVETGAGYSLIEPLTLYTTIIEDLCNDKNLFLEYPKEIQGNYWTDGKPADLPHPVGMSGGGIWQFKHDSTDANPENLRLLGIVNHFDNLEKYVKATVITHVLDLLPKV